MTNAIGVDNWVGGFSLMNDWRVPAGLLGLPTWALFTNLLNVRILADLDGFLVFCGLYCHTDDVPGCVLSLGHLVVKLSGRKDFGVQVTSQVTNYNITSELLCGVINSNLRNCCF